MGRTVMKNNQYSRCILSAYVPVRLSYETQSLMITLETASNRTLNSGSLHLKIIDLNGFRLHDRCEGLYLMIFPSDKGSRSLTCILCGDSVTFDQLMPSFIQTAQLYGTAKHSLSALPSYLYCIILVFGSP